MEQAQQDFLKIIEQAQKILVIPSSVEPDEQLASAALATGLRDIGKKAFLAETDKLPQLENVSWSDLDIEHEQANDIVITVNNTKGKLEEIRYEKTGEQGGAVKIILGSSLGLISKNDIRIETGEHKFDLVILTGIQEPKQLDRFKEKYFPTLVRSKVVSIGYLHPRQQISSQHFLAPEASCLAEAVIFILTGFDSAKPELTPKVAQILLASFLASTENFQNQRIDARTLNRIARLLDFGANLEQARRIAPTLKSGSQISEDAEAGNQTDEIPAPIKPLLEKAKLNQKNFLRWITLEEPETQGLLPETDFIMLTQQMAGLEPAMPHNLVIANLASGNPHPVIKGWLKSTSGAVISELTELLNGFVFNGVLTFPIRASNLEDAENKLLKLAERLFGK